MAANFTYDNATVTPAPKDRVRKVLGDTGIDGNSWLLSDQEILAELATTSYSEAVASLALGLASRFAQYPDEVDTAGNSKMKWSERVKTWRNLADKMIQNPTTSAPKRTMAKIGNLTNPASPGIRS